MYWRALISLNSRMSTQLSFIICLEYLFILDGRAFSKFAQSPIILGQFVEGLTRITVEVQLTVWCVRYDHGRFFDG